MAIAASIDILLSANTSKLDKGLQNASKSIKGFSSSFGGIASTAANLVAGFLTVHTAISAFSQAFSDLNELVKTSDALGIPADRLAGIQLAATDAEISIDTINTALARFAKTADPSKGSIDEQFRAASEQIQNMENPIERVQLAMKLFGRNGAELLPILMQGAEGFDANQEAAKKYGLALNDLNSDKIKEMDNTLDSLSNTWQGFWRQLVVGTAPAITAAFQGFIDFWANFGADMKELDRVLFKRSGGASGSWVEDTGKSAKQLGDDFEELTKNSDKFKESIESPFQKFADRMKELHSFFEHDLISPEQLTSGIEDARKTLTEEQKRMEDEQKKFEKSQLPGDFLGIGSGIDDIIGGAIRGVESVGSGVASTIDALVANMPDMQTIGSPGAIDAGSLEAFSLINNAQRNDIQQLIQGQKEATQVLKNTHELLKDLKPLELLSLNLG